MDFVNLGFALDRAAAVYPERSFLVAGSRALTFAEVARRCASVSAWLVDQGLVRGDRVAAVVTNQPEYVEMLLACARIGVVIVPMNYRRSVSEIRASLEDCSARVVLLDEQLVDDHLESVRAVGARPVVIGRHADAVSYDTLLEADRSTTDPEPWISLDPNADQAIHYTSGTTGRPKGVRRSHAANVAMAHGSLCALPLGPDDAWLYALPPHSAGFYALAMPALYVGARLVLCARFEPDEFRAAIREHGVTHTMLAPTMWSMLATSEGVTSEDFRSLRHAIWGGMPMADATLELLDDLLPVPCLGGYGMTESTCVVWSTAQVYASGRRHAVGRPVPGIQIRIAGVESAPVAQGERGEVQLRGPIVMTGYAGDPVRTEEAMTSDGWLRTGDIGWLDTDGVLTVVDRSKNMIISGAENVYPNEIETVLARMDGVLEVAVVGLDHPTWGQQVAAAIVSDRAVDLESVSAYCRGQGLSDFKKPRVVRRLDGLPRNALGKVERPELIRLLAGSSD